MKYIQERGFTIIPIDYDDEMHYANNFLTIAPRHIMAVAGQSETLQQRFRDAGVTVEWVPLENLIDGYGAAHCMTQVLQREVYEDYTPTSIRQINTIKTDDQPTYNLNGMQVSHPSKGLYVKKGRIVIMKKRHGDR